MSNTHERLYLPWSGLTWAKKMTIKSELRSLLRADLIAGTACTVKGRASTHTVEVITFQRKPILRLHTLLCYNPSQSLAFEPSKYLFNPDSFTDDKSKLGAHVCGGQVDAASAARSHSQCPAVLVSITLSASTESCASDMEMSIVADGVPRDLNTYGNPDSAAGLEGVDTAILCVDHDRFRSLVGQGISGLIS